MEKETQVIELCKDTLSDNNGAPIHSKSYKRHKGRLAKYFYLSSLFGDDWFAVKAEGFARFFGTPLFLVGQTIIVMVWIGFNALGLVKFDLYPFILLNLAFSLQAAYAAPLILLAQTRQADREKARTELDVLHREDLAHSSEERLTLLIDYNEKLMMLLEQNTQLTEMVKNLSEGIEQRTLEIHQGFMKDS